MARLKRQPGLFDGPAQPAPEPRPTFDGPLDEGDPARLATLLERVRAFMVYGPLFALYLEDDSGEEVLVRNIAIVERWFTLDEIQKSVGGTTASVSARLRDLRKKKFGGWDVQRRHRGDPKRGLYEYRAIAPERSGP